VARHIHRRILALFRAALSRSFHFFDFSLWHSFRHSIRLFLLFSARTS